MLPCPSDMPERSIGLTEGAKICLMESYWYAVRLKSSKIDTAHLTLALVEDSNVRWILEDLDISPQRVREFVKLGLLLSPDRVGASYPDPSANGFTDELHQCLIFARESARADGLSQVGTERLAMGVIRQLGCMGSYPLTEDSFTFAMRKSS